jgi:hypothetical protein
VRFHPALAQQLSRDDRVHTYAGFHIGDLLGDLRSDLRGEMRGEPQGA